ncbi:MAG TPA: putative quinol monooxygenase [Brevibacterium sp.]|nr:putative quinol monooxygenase [Brevibacterium sp.]
MYFIAVRFEVKPESVETFPEAVREFTEAVRAEEGNLFFDWAKSLENDNEYVLLEGYTDEGAAPHVQSDHFAKGLEAIRPHLTRTPRIISRQVEGDGWDEMGELKLD